MNAAQYLSWARPLVGRAGGPAAFFLSLPERLLDAAGPGHFLESSVSSTRGLGRVKLALILDAEPGPLAADARRRDAPAKARAAGRLLDALPAGYDRAAAGGVLAALERWGLRGSLMLSLDYERAAGRFGKLSLYGYLGRLHELLSVFGLEALEGALAPLAGPSLAFFGVDLAPGAPAALKLYNRGPVTASARASALAEVGALRDLTRMTRVGGGATPKEYLRFSDGAPLTDLARLRLCGGADGWLSPVARSLPGQRARFVGFDAGEVEVYFDRGGHE